MIATQNMVVVVEPLLATESGRMIVDQELAVAVKPKKAAEVLAIGARTRTKLARMKVA